VKKFRVGTALAVIAASALAVTACAPSAGRPAEGGSGEGVSIWYLADNDMVADAIERFKADNPDVKVDATEISNDQYKTKIRVGLGTPSGPDVFFTWAGAGLAEYVASDLVAPLDDLVASDGLTDVFGEGVLAQGQVDGAQYALPIAVEASQIWYNTEIFDELGVSAPTTWEEFIELIGSVKSAGITPIAMANKTQWPGSHWWSELVTLACGPEFLAQVSAGSQDVSFEDPCVVDAHGRIQEMVTAGAFNDGFNGLDYDSGESRQLFWAEKAAMNHMGNWTISSAKEEAPEMLDKLAFFNVPAWSGAVGTSDMMTGGVSPMYAISKTAKDMDSAVALMRYLIDEETAAFSANSGRIPVREGTAIEDPLVQQVADAINSASYVSAWPDQALVPELSTEMLTQVQALFGMETTPEAASSALQAVYQKVNQ